MDLRSYKRCIGYLDPNESDHAESTITLDEDKLEEILTYSGLKMNKNKNMHKGKTLKYRATQSCSDSSLTDGGYNNYNFNKNNKHNEKCGYANYDNILIGKNEASALKENSHSSESITLASSKHNLQKPVEQKLTFVKNNPHVRSIFINKNEENSHKTTQADKASYCRPVSKPCSQDVVRKTIERNIKLQFLLKKLVLAREKEKHNEIWDKYINELRMKHGYYGTQTIETPKQQGQLLCSGTETNIRDRNVYRPKGNSASVCRAVSSYASDVYCYPTSAEGRLMMINKEIAMRHTSWQCQHSNRDNVIIVEKDKTNKDRKQHNKIWKSHGYASEIDYETNKCPMCSGKSKVGTKPVSQQTEKVHCKCPVYSEITGVELKTEEDALTSLDQLFKGVNNQFAMIEKKQKTEKEAFTNLDYQLFDGTKNPLVSIEKKIDSLIESFKAFVAEYTTKKSSATESTNTDAACGCEYGKSDKPTWLHLKRDITCGHAQKSESILMFPRHSCKWKDAMDTFSCEEDKTDKITRDIDEILSKNSIEWSNPVKFPDEIPTKDCTIKVSNSLQTTHSKNRGDSEDVGVAEIFSVDDSKCMTIAVNTDPLGLSALFRVSADTVRQILSHMPSIDCSCLSRLPVCAAPPNDDVIARFMCNICGASFSRPSQLSDHIQKHNLGESRQCCVCKQLVKLESHCEHLFACQYCGQVFTRAYCRELHEQACARTVGKRHDVTPSRILLT